jgi:hypothetical protein
MLVEKKSEIYEDNDGETQSPIDGTKLCDQKLNASSYTINGTTIEYYLIESTGDTAFIKFIEITLRYDYINGIFMAKINKKTSDMFMSDVYITPTKHQFAEYDSPNDVLRIVKSSKHVEFAKYVLGLQRVRLMMLICAHEPTMKTLPCDLVRKLAFKITD